MGFLATTLASPLVIIVALAGTRDFPDSALEPRTFVIGAALGAVASIGLAWALDGPLRRAMVIVQGTVGFSLAGVLLVAHRDEGFLPVVLAGAVVGVAFGLAAPAGVPLGAVVGAATFSMAAALASTGNFSPVAGFVGGFIGIAAWGAAMGATVGWCVESAGRGPSWAALRRPAGVVLALAVLAPAQAAGAVVVLRRDPPRLCFETRPGPAGAVAAVADFDGDGDLDALQQGQSDVRLLRNAGGVLSPEPPPAALPNGYLVMGDADADGDIDVFAGRTEPRQRSSVVVVARNDGRGAFTEGPRAAIETDQPRPIAVADLDGDRAADLVVSGKNGPVVLWSRPGRLEQGLRLPSWRNVIVGDVNGDGRTDVVSFDGRGGLEVHRVTGQAQLETARVPVPGYVTGVTLVDLDGDGDQDLAVGTIRKVVLLANDGGGTFSAWRTLSGGRDNLPLTAGDLDGDGDMDLIASDGASGEELTAGIWAWENQGAGRWSHAGRIGTTPGDLVAADLTGDGRADIVTGYTSGRFSGALLIARPC